MNKYVTGGLIFVGGAAIGSLTTFFVCRELYRKKLEEEKEADQQYYIELLGYSESERDPADTEDYDTKTNEPNESKPLTEEELHRMSYTEFMDRKKNEALKNRTRIQYDKIPFNSEEEEVDDVTMAINNDNQDLDILIINSEQFASEHRNFEKETLLWWPKNNILSTEDYDILDVPELIGNNWKDRIGEFEKDVVYVRNMIAETDYEIIQQHDDYYDYKE